MTFASPHWLWALALIGRAATVAAAAAVLSIVRRVVLRISVPPKGWLLGKTLDRAQPPRKMRRISGSAARSAAGPVRLFLPSTRM